MKKLTEEQQDAIRRVLGDGISIREDWNDPKRLAKMLGFWFVLMLIPIVILWLI